MDKDLERPETEREEPEAPPCPQIKGAKVKLPRKPKVPKRREEADLRPKAGKGEEPPREETDDSSSVATDTSTTDTEASFREELAVKRSQPPPPLEKEKEEQSFKPKNKKQQPANHTKDKSLSSSSLELPYVTPLENKRKAFTSKTALGPALTGPGSPAVTKVLPSKPRVPRGKLEELRPSPLAKHLPSPAVGGAGGGGVGVGGGGGCAGRSSSGSSSEGESNVSPPPEWDCVPLLKNTSAVDSLHQISLQTMQADPFLKRPMRTPPPPPPSSSSSSSLYPGAGGLGLSPLCDLGSKVTPAPKGKLIKSTSLPGQNGNPTFAAVAAGYDKSPGGSSSGRSPISRTGVAPSTSVDSDCSDSPGPLSPIGNGRATSGMSNTFSAFGSNNLFNLSGVFSGMTSARSVVEPPPSWSDFGHLSSPAPCPPPPTSAWPSETLEPWPCSTASTGSTTTSILGSSSLWSSSPPFSPSIWSTSADSSPLHTFSSPPAPNRHLSDLLLGGDVCPPSPASPQLFLYLFLDAHPRPPYSTSPYSTSSTSSSMLTPVLPTPPLPLPPPLPRSQPSLLHLSLLLLFLNALFMGGQPHHPYSTSTPPLTPTLPSPPLPLPPPLLRPPPSLLHLLVLHPSLYPQPSPILLLGGGGWVLVGRVLAPPPSAL
ncbi:unnamed protein product [Gadus morhua 'NCC']